MMALLLAASLAASYEVPFAPAPPTIDGDLADWTEPERLDIPDPTTRTYPGWKGAQDLTAIAFFCYDERALYFACVVADDKFNQPYAGLEASKGDSVELLLDVRGDSAIGSHLFHDDDYCFGFALSRNGPTVYCRYPEKREKVATIELAVVAGEKTLYEAAIPWSELDPLEPYTGRWTPRFSIVVNDNDGTDREGYAELTPRTAVPDPTQFQTMILAPNERLRARTPKSWRPGANGYDAPWLEVKVNGDLAEWAAVEPIELPKPTETTYPGWEGPNDLSGKLWLAWDSRALYLAAAITDDDHVQPARGTEPARGDSIQLYVDGFGDSFYPSSWLRHRDDQVFTFSSAGLSYGFPRRLTAGRVVFRREGKVSCYEAELPWEVLLPATALDPVRFSLVVNDADGGKLQGSIELWPGAVERKPSGSRRLAFVPATKLKDVQTYLEGLRPKFEAEELEAALRKPLKK